MVDGDGHLSTMIHQIGRLNDTVAEQNLLPVLLSFTDTFLGSRLSDNSGRTAETHRFAI